MIPENYKQLLSEFVKFKSISTDSQYKSDITKTVEWLKELFEKHSFETHVIEKYGNPIVIARYEKDPGLETCLIYGHYDVQPADKNEGWTNDPFELSEDNERLYARGVIDNKGQVLVHMITAFELIASGDLKYNLVFMLEGDEETGSPLMPKFIEEHKDLLKSDFAIVSDGEMENPTFEAGFRGGFNFELTVKTSTTDLHSGLYGHTTPNAIHELSNVIASFYDKNERIAIDGFYDDVDEIPDAVRKQNESIPFGYEKFREQTGCNSFTPEKGYDFFTQVGLRPAIEVTGITGGYSGEGYRNSIPATATAKINFRLVKNQNAKKIEKAVFDHISKQVHPKTEWHYQLSDPYEGIKLDLTHPKVTEAAKVIESSYEQKPIFLFCGGGLPIITLYSEVLNIPVLPIPFANIDCAMHAANENFRKSYLQDALTFSKHFFSTS